MRVGDWRLEIGDSGREGGRRPVAVSYQSSPISHLHVMVMSVYWKGCIDLRFERVDITTDIAVDPKSLPQLIAALTLGTVRVAGADGVLAVQAPQYHVGVLYFDGRVAKRLDFRCFERRDR